MKNLLKLTKDEYFDKVSKPLDLYMRVGLGQSWIIGEVLRDLSFNAGIRDYSSINQATDMISSASTCIYDMPQNSSKGIYSKELHPDFIYAYRLYKRVNYLLSKDSDKYTVDSTDFLGSETANGQDKYRHEVSVLDSGEIMVTLNNKASGVLKEAQDLYNEVTSFNLDKVVKLLEKKQPDAFPTEFNKQHFIANLHQAFSIFKLLNIKERIDSKPIVSR